VVTILFGLLELLYTIYFNVQNVSFVVGIRKNDNPSKSGIIKKG
jgi:hypothetical protein